MKPKPRQPRTSLISDEVPRTKPDVRGQMMASVDQDDAALMARIARGDAAANRLLLAAKAPRLFALAGRLLGDAADAEEAVQDTFLRVWRHADRWTPEGPPVDAWLHVIILNQCRDRLRRRKPTGGDMIDIADPAPNAEQELLASEREVDVRRAIGCLPDRQREAILLVHYQDLSGADAAAALAISIEALESLLARARRTLRSRFALSVDL